MTGATVRPGYGHPSLNAAAVSDVTLRSGEVHSATSSQRPCHVAHPFHTKNGTAVNYTLKRRTRDPMFIDDSTI